MECLVLFVIDGYLLFVYCYYVLGYVYGNLLVVGVMGVV